MPIAERRNEAAYIPSLHSYDHNTSPPSSSTPINTQNLANWSSVAQYWDATQEEGNDLFTELLLPTVEKLAAPQAGERVLDLATGSGIIARRLAPFVGPGGSVRGTDGVVRLLELARERGTEVEGARIEYEELDCVDAEAMGRFAEAHAREYNVITCTMAVKEFASLEPMAKALPKLLAPGGRVVIVTLHPAFSKPAAHRTIEVLEDPSTGKQEARPSIKVTRYLDIPPVSSEAIRGQPVATTLFHRPFQHLFGPYFKEGLVLDALEEPAFTGEKDPKHLQSYHNFQQFPLLIAFRLRLMG